ncbi:hypothetical protein FRC06_007984 [Ceratobasidium sp. 370]|nr:hypothetical protein FRC06_007984 [Ceratobasidium sp. 370]
MLGACRRVGPVSQRRAPKTEAEWLAIPEEQCDSGDDEEGDSDAGSINDDVERGLPTSAHWDPETKKSTTPRGDVPHPYPEVVERELERNRKYDELVVARSQGRTQATRPRRQVARGTTAGSVASVRRGVQSTPRGSRGATARLRSSSRLSTGVADTNVNPCATSTPLVPAQPPRRRSTRASGQTVDPGQGGSANQGGMLAYHAPTTPHGEHGSEAHHTREPDRDVEMPLAETPGAQLLPQFATVAGPHFRSGDGP